MIICLFTTLFVGIADRVILLYGIRATISDSGNEYTLEPKTKETERRKHILLPCFFFSVSFNLFLYGFFSHQVKIAQTSHFRYKRPTDTMIQHTPEK